MPRFLNPFPQFCKLQNGALQPNSDGYLYFYVNGTSTLASIWTNSAMSVAADNPQRLDAEGRMSQNVFIDTDLFRVRLGDSNDATIWDKSDFSVADPQAINAIVAELEALIESITSDLFSNNYVNNPALQVDLLDTATTPVTLTTAYVDNVTGFACAVLNNVSAGSAGQSAVQIGQSGYSLELANVSCTSAGTPSIRARIPYADAIGLSNKTLTIQAVVKHDVGAAVSYTISTAVANAQDDFTTVTSTGISSTTSVASGTSTTISVTSAFGDVTNGLQIVITAAPNQALVGKSFFFSDIACYVSGVLLPFHVPLFVEQELANIDLATTAELNDGLKDLAERTYTSIVQVAALDVKTSGTSATWTWPSGVTAVEVELIGGGAGGKVGIGVPVGGTASTVIYNSVTYSAGGGLTTGAGGTATNGDLNISGGVAISIGSIGGGTTKAPGSYGAGASYGGGGGGSDSSGGGGATCIKRIEKVAGLDTITYSVGEGGAAGGSAGAGAAGVVIFRY